MLTYPTNLWVDSEREWLLNFHDSVLVTAFLRHSELVVVFLANAIVSQVSVVSVCAGSLGGWDDEAGSFTIRHRIRFAFTMCCSFWNCLRFMVHSTRCHRWISSVFQTILESTCFTSYQVFSLHVPTRTLCILASDSIFLGLPRHHHQV